MPFRDLILIAMCCKKINAIIMVRQHNRFTKRLVKKLGRYRKDAHYNITVTVTAEIVIEPMTETTVIGKVNNPKDYVVKVLDPVSFKNGR